jgi:hypothetical protein
MANTTSTETKTQTRIAKFSRETARAVIALRNSGDHASAEALERFAVAHVIEIQAGRA